MIGEFIAAPDRWSGDPAFVALKARRPIGKPLTTADNRNVVAEQILLSTFNLRDGTSCTERLGNHDHHELRKAYAVHYFAGTWWRRDISSMVGR